MSTLSPCKCFLSKSTMLLTLLIPSLLMGCSNAQKPSDDLELLSLNSQNQAPIVLHHTPGSPYSEKARTMLGYTELPWLSVSAGLMPRPVQEELVGGYARRIPLLQIGADVFVDASLIAQEIAHLSGNPDLDWLQQKPEIQKFIYSQEQEMFDPMIYSMSKMQMLWGLLHSLSPWETVAFTRDRVGSLSEFDMPERDPAIEQLALNKKKEEFTKALGTSPFLFGSEKPTIADFSSFHLVWYRHERLDQPMYNDEEVTQLAWLKRMQSIGHGKYTEIEPTLTWEIAKKYSPRKIPEAMKQGEKIGQLIQLKPNDSLGFATPAIEGVLIGEDEHQYILQRDTKNAGTVHVHFPKVAYGACF